MADQCPEYMIGKTLATLKPLPWYGLPYPISSPYLPVAVVKVCGDMSQKGYGFPSVVWTWSYFSQYHVYTLYDFFDNPTDVSAQVYVRTYKDVGALRDAANFLVQMYKPLDNQGKQLIVGSRFWYSNISAPIRHMVEI